MFHSASKIQKYREWQTKKNPNLSGKFQKPEWTKKELLFTTDAVYSLL